MTTETTPAPVAPVATDPPAVQPVVQPAAQISTAPLAAGDRAIVASGAEVKLTSDALKQRLLDERRAAEKQFLARYGADKPEDVDAKLKKLADYEASQLSEKERTEKQIVELTKRADRAVKADATASAAVQELFEALPEIARTAIEELQPATPEERLSLVRTYRKMAAAAALSVVPVGGAAAPLAPAAPPPPLPAPITTSPAAPAPKPGATTKYQDYESLKAKNHVAAGMFYQAHKREIEASRPTTA